MSFVLQASAQLRLRSRGFFPTRGNQCVKLLEVWTFIFVLTCSQLVTHSATVVRTFCPRLFRIKTTGAAWHACVRRCPIVKKARRKQCTTILERFQTDIFIGNH